MSNGKIKSLRRGGEKPPVSEPPIPTEYDAKIGSLTVQINQGRVDLDNASAEIRRLESEIRRVSPILNKLIGKKEQLEELRKEKIDAKRIEETKEGKEKVVKAGKDEVGKAVSET